MAEPMELFEAEIDAVIAEFEGDPRAAIRALLYDLAALARDGATAISRGYVRGRWPVHHSMSAELPETRLTPKRTGER